MQKDSKNAEFLRLFMSNRHEILAFMKGMVRKPSAAEDIFQEVSIILWDKFDTYNPQKPFGSWARGVSSNKVMQYWQKQKDLPILFSPDLMNEVLAAYDRTDLNTGEMIEALEGCKQKLNEKQSQLLSFKYEKGWKLDRIAESLGKTLAATQKSLSRLRFSLQECVKQQLKQKEI